MTERVTVSIEDHVAVVRLNRPDKHNALDLPMFAALAQTGQSLADDSSVRAVVPEAAGANLCAGFATSTVYPCDTPLGAAALAPGHASPACLS